MYGKTNTMLQSKINKLIFLKTFFSSNIWIKLDNQGKFPLSFILNHQVLWQNVCYLSACPHLHLPWRRAGLFYQQMSKHWEN